MATLIVGTDEFTLDDRLLEHVKFVTTQKLRRSESFLLTWSYPADQGSGRRSVWIHEGSMLHFRFTKQRPIALNAEWLHNLLEASHSIRGLNLDDVPEPTSLTASTSERQPEGVGRRS